MTERSSEHNTHTCSWSESDACMCTTQMHIPYMFKLHFLIFLLFLLVHRRCVVCRSRPTSSSSIFLLLTICSSHSISWSLFTGFTSNIRNSCHRHFFDYFSGYRIIFLFFFPLWYPSLVYHRIGRFSRQTYSKWTLNYYVSMVPVASHFSYLFLASSNVLSELTLMLTPEQTNDGCENGKTINKPFYRTE